MQFSNVAIISEVENNSHTCKLQSGYKSFFFFELTPGVVGRNCGRITRSAAV